VNGRERDERDAGSDKERAFGGAVPLPRPAMTMIHRRFAELAEGPVHYREAGTDHAGPPLLLLHASPASSAFLAPLIAALATTRHVIAPDTLGNGDSAPPAPEAPDMAYYGDSVARFLDALAIDRCDLYGTHTGAHSGVELALQAPERVRRLLLHGVLVLDDAEREAFLAHYAPPQAPDLIGSQFNWAWHQVRDQMIFWPHFRKDAAHLRAAGQLDAGFLHALTVELLKNLTHYHKTYHAVFRHDLPARLAAVTVPAVLLTHPDEPLHASVESVHAACPAATLRLIDGDGGVAATARAVDSVCAAA
jgi:pimeloyl-ACP methyl ester carboxylesterase